MAGQAVRKPQREQNTAAEKQTAAKNPRPADKKKKKKPFGPGAAAILILVCLILGVMGYRIYTLKQKEAEITQQIEDLKEQKAEETERSEELDALEEYYNSDSYKEDVAHSKLGLANDNEIIFKESEE